MAPRALPPPPPPPPPPSHVAAPQGLSRARKAKTARMPPAAEEVEAAEACRRGIQAWVPQMHAALALAGIAPRNV